jgi:hypothetical protein
MLHSAPAGHRAVTPAGRSAAFLAGVHLGTRTPLRLPGIGGGVRLFPAAAGVVCGLLRSVAPTGGYWPRDRARPPGSVQATTPGLVARPGVVARSEVDAVPDVPARAAASLVVSRLINAPRQMRLAGRGT